jgi:hypothetical protein
MDHREALKTCVSTADSASSQTNNIFCLDYGIARSKQDRIIVRCSICRVYMVCRTRDSKKTKHCAPCRRTLPRLALCDEFGGDRRICKACHGEYYSFYMTPRIGSHHDWRLSVPNGRSFAVRLTLDRVQLGGIPPSSPQA